MTATRRLAAIAIADVVGYSRLMEADEAGTLAALKGRRKAIVDPVVRDHGGRIVKVMGDGVLIEFASAVNAVEAALELQAKMAEANAPLPDDRRIVLRIGINLGDVIGEGADIYGDGVNIAARLEALAEPGGICVSAKVREELHGKVDHAFDDMGEVELKNIARPVRVYRVGRVTGRAEATNAEAPAAKPSIAVLPFTNMSGDGEQQYFSDGITEDIITELSRFRQLQVLARNSSFRFRGQDIDMIRAGRELRVQYLVEGSVRKVGQRIRITAQLIDAKTGNHIWADRFDRAQDEMFEVQDQVVRTIVSTLVGRVQADGSELARRKPPASLAAYECVLRAEALPVYDLTAEVEARRLYERAIQIDPGYARAYAMLSNLTIAAWLRDTGGSDGLLDRAFELARTAVGLDENDSTCQMTIAAAHMNRQDYGLAEHHYRKALDLNPNNPLVVATVGTFHTYRGNCEEGRRCFEEAKALDPFFEPDWYWPTFGINRFCLRQYDDAVAALQRSSSMPFWVHAYLTASFAHSGDVAAADRHGAEVLRLSPGFSTAGFAAKEWSKGSPQFQHLVDGLRKAGLPE